MPNEADNLSQRFLMNYKSNNNYLGFQASVIDFFTDSAVATFQVALILKVEKALFLYLNRRR